tara:strand:+ start:48 stop:563 length:516 start_codon:yes stop_codon:yes gene_type:complete
MNTFNYIFIQDNFLNDIECDKLIDYYHKNKDKIVTKNNYIFCNMQPNKFFKNKLSKISSMYIEKYPEANITFDKWYLEELRIKHFKPKNSFDNWHSEHQVSTPLRMLALQIYLSSHKCGTEFYRYKTIISKKGRLAVWPAYFTHTHKGQVCPDNLNRFILSGYYRLRDEHI